MQLEHKIREAVTLIREGLKMSQRPVLYCSFGKDSMVLLHLITRYMGESIDLVFHREPFQTHKYQFADRIIVTWNLIAFDYPPSATAMWLGKEILAYTNYYEIGTKPDGGPATLALPKNILEPKNDERWVCGWKRFLDRPTGNFNYPWDCAFIGHKNCDEDQIAGKIPLHKSIVVTEGGPIIVFPLRYWSHDDVWDYTGMFNLPVDYSRYNQKDRKEHESKLFNSDYFTACTNCIDRRKSGKVFCPLVNGEIESIADQVAYNTVSLSYYGEDNAP
jgi:3'-phosphoadenosine 5'-phosphosulfate sulfotransferase (PAPS reductase)/FAD synthetase